MLACLKASNRASTGMIYWTIVFCSTPVHCFTAENFVNCFKPVKSGIWQKRTSNLSTLERFKYLTLLLFCLRAAGISNLNSFFIYPNRCMTIFFNNWWNTSTIIVSWMLTSSWRHAKFFIWWTQFLLSFGSRLARYRSICCRVKLCVYSGHFSSRFSCSSEDIRQIE